MADVRTGLGNGADSCSWEKTLTAMKISDREQRKAMAGGSYPLTQGQKFATPINCALTLPCKEALND